MTAHLDFAPLVDAIARRVVELLAEQQQPAGVTREWLDAKAAASYLGCKPQRVYDLVSAGRLRPARDGSRLLFKREWLDHYLTEPSVDDATI